LEGKLKTAESRVRRLEDLLHRQTQASRPNLNNVFQMPSQQLSERGDSTISVKSPQPSEDRRRSVEGPDALVHRIQQLEAELGAEKERSAGLEKDLDGQITRYNDIKDQMDEANSTKKDLLENLEALKREFTEERKALEDEIRRLQARLEDTEDEMEHFGESRENEKATYDETIDALRLEIERLKKEKDQEAHRMEGQVDALSAETRLQRETIEAQERQLRAIQDEAQGYRKEVDALSKVAHTQLKALRDLWHRFSPGQTVPDDLSEFTEIVYTEASNALARVRSLETEMALLRSALDSAQRDIESRSAEKAAAAERLTDEEAKSVRLGEALAKEQARVLVLEGELADTREQLSQLRAKVADGENGSESLRKELEEEENKARHLEERLQESQVTLAGLTVRFDTRSEHAKDLTQRLYSHNERLTHLLERLGFSVTRQGSSMVIQKVPRSERTSQNANDSDPSSSLRRSGTIGSRAAIVSSLDLDLLNWVNCPDAETESEKYDAYISSLGSFDMDAFCEVVYRRVRDVEHMARKLQRDARAYREKAHALQKEAHEKIAYKHFKEGDLALFLPTRNQTTGAWAAFNVGFPHYFLREQEAHRLSSREWLVARISRIQERVVDLSKSLQNPPGLGRKAADGGTESGSVNDDDNDNPFDLSDGLRWYLIDAAEDKSGAPSTPGLAKSTVAANNVEAMAERHTHGRAGPKGGGTGGRSGVASGIEGVSKTLSKSLESRRSSTGSKKALPFAIGISRGRDSAANSETNSVRAMPADTPAPTSPTSQHARHDSQRTSTTAADGARATSSNAGNDMDSLMGP
jgi:autophagy-related protein 11